MKKCVDPGELAEVTDIRWGMLLSHHSPCDYDRTFSISSLRICTRCFGVLIGIIGGVALTLRVVPEYLLIFSLVLPLPAVMDFMLNELQMVKGNNGRRLVTGIMLGIAVGFDLYAVTDIGLLQGFAQLAWLVVLEFFVVAVLLRTGFLDEYVSRYEKGVRKN
ncbi:MAG: DUF2085 domain-containing protein [Thermoleophilia bacterium]